MSLCKVAASVVGRLSLGYLSDKFNPWSLGVSTLTLTALISFVLWGVASHTLAGVLSFGIAYGLVAGGWSCLFSGFIRRVASTFQTAFLSFQNTNNFLRGRYNTIHDSIRLRLILSRARKRAIDADSLCITFLCQYKLIWR